MLATRKTIGVRLNTAELEALRSVADREDRDPRRQAQRLIRDGLIRVGALNAPIDDCADRQPAEAAL